MSADRPQAMGGGQQGSARPGRAPSRTRLARAPHQHHRHPVGEPSVRRGADQRMRRRGAEHASDRARARRARRATRTHAGSCAKRRPLQSRRRLRMRRRRRSVHIAFRRQSEHVPAVWNRGFVVMAALAIVSRAAVVCLALAGGAACAAEAEPHAATDPRAASGKVTCLNASDTRDQVKAHKLHRALRRAEIRRPAAEGRGAFGQALRQRRRVYLRDHPSSPRRPPHPYPDGGGNRKARRASRARAA